MAAQKWSDYTAATKATDYIDATEMLIKGADGNVLKGNLADMREAFFGDIKTESVTIATAGVLTLNATPVELIAAPGSGYAIECISASVKMVYNSAAYATNTIINLDIGASNKTLMTLDCLAATVSTFRQFSIAPATGATDTQIIENQAMNVTVQTGDPTAGDSDIEIFVMYRLIAV